MANKNTFDKDPYKQRKLERTNDYNHNHGRKLVVCNACSGSGVYDIKNSPACGNCNGTGKVKK